MMLNVNWPQMRKLYKKLQLEHNIADNDQVTFQCVMRNIRTGEKKAGRRSCSYKNFLQVFWDLCESPLQILTVHVQDLKGKTIYKHSCSHIEQMPVGGNPHIIENWNKLDPEQKDTWLEITMSQIEANA